MDHLQNQSDGNPIRSDEYGNPSGHLFSGATTGLAGAGLHLGGGQATLHRSGSSSSSEDDGYGGRRRKKGMKQKIKEMLPGGHEPGLHHVGPKAQYSGGPVTTHGGGYGTNHGPNEHHHEKKGIMDKIKDKLHGHH